MSEHMTDAAGSPKTLENKDIQALLPHRYPFLLVDRIVDIQPDGAGGTGIKNVTANEPQFMGHFPGNPVMPGVLIIEGMAQTAGAIAASLQGAAGSSSVLFLTIDDEHARHHGVAGKMPHEQRLVRRHVLDARAARAVRQDIDDAVHQQERIAVRQQRLNILVLQRLERFRCTSHVLAHLPLCRTARRFSAACARRNSRCGLAGAPISTAPSGTSLITPAPAAMRAPSPIVTCSDTPA